MRIYLYAAFAIAACIVTWAIYHAGGASCRADVTVRDNKALLAAQKEVVALTAKVAAQEAQHSADMQAIQSTHAKELTDATNERDQALADVRTGKLRLRNVRACPSAGSSSAADKAQSPAGESDQARADRRALEDAQVLIDFAAERDRVALERNECVEIATKDRR